MQHAVTADTGNSAHYAYPANSFRLQMLQQRRQQMLAFAQINPRYCDSLPNCHTQFPTQYPDQMVATPSKVFTTNKLNKP